MRKWLFPLILKQYSTADRAWVIDLGSNFNSAPFELDTVVGIVG